MFPKRKPETFSTDSEGEDDAKLTQLENPMEGSFSEEEAGVNIGRDHVYSAFKNSFYLSKSTESETKLKGDDLIRSKIAQSHPIKSTEVSTKPLASSSSSSSTTTTTTTATGPTTTGNYVYPAVRNIIPKNSVKLNEIIYPKLTSNIDNKPLESHKPVQNNTQLTKEEKLIKEVRQKLGMDTEMPKIQFSSPSPNTKKERFTFESIMDEEKKTVPMKQEERRYFGLTERLATQMLFEDQVQNSAVKSIMSMGKYAPLGNWSSSSSSGDKPCQKTTVMAHIRQFHNEFYQLLWKQNLVEIVKNRLPGVVIVIPHRDALAVLDPTSEETRSLLLYHILISNGTSIQEVEGMVNFETLAGDYVQVESSNGVHYINGNLLIKPDVNCLFSIYHIDKVLDRSQVMEVDDSPTPPEDLPPPLPVPEDGNDMEVGGEGEGGEEEGGEEEEREGATLQQAVKIETRFLSSRISAAPRSNNSNNNNSSPTIDTKLPLLQTLIMAMNQQFFSAPIEVGDHLISLQNQPQKSLIILSTFPTTELFQSYESNRMLDISRIKIASRFELSFSPEQHHHLSGDLQLTQYVCNNDNSSQTTSVRKSDLNRGLLAVSINSQDGRGFRMMMCKLECTKDDGNCYISQDENLLLRFQEGKLDSITVNHAGLSSLPLSASPLMEKSFFEYSLAPDLYKNHLTRGQFDMMLLSKGKVGRWIKKQTQKGIAKTRCGVKRLEAINLKPVQNSYIQSFLVEKVSAQMDDSKAQSVSVTINLFDKACRPLDSRSTSGKRYSVVTKHGDPVIVCKLDISFSDESHLSRNTELYDRHHMIEIQVGGQKKLTIHLHGVNRKSTFFSYYGLLGLDLYVFTFDSLSGRLQYIYAMRSVTHVARKIIASKAI